MLGTERHESRRIDNQLRGRSGRQGDPGESRFYLSLEDDLMRMFNSARVESIMSTLKLAEDVPIESKIVTNAIRSAQHQVEQQNFEIRKDVLKYDEVLNRQRQVIYAERREVLEGADLHEQVRKMIDEVVEGYVAGATSEGFPEEWDLDKLWQAFRQLYPVRITQDELIEAAGGDRAGLTGEFLTEQIKHDAQAAYDRREEEVTPETMRELERQVVLSVLDRQVAGPPVRDGLPPGRHQPARLLAARPAGRVPAGGVRDVQRDARRHPRGVGRLPVQPQGRGAGQPDCRGDAGWRDGAGGCAGA